MRRIAVGFFAGVGLLTVLLVIAVAVIVIRLKPGTPALPGNIILSVDLTQGLADRPDQGGWLELIVGAKPTLRDFLDAIEAAGDDPRVKGLVARIGSDQFALAEAQQIRDAIKGFRAKGKFAIAFSDSFGEFGGGTRPYYLASAFDRIWLQPMGTVGLTGLYAETPYFKGALDMLGIVAEFDHIGRYKTAANVLTNTRMTAPDREQIEALLTSASAQVVAGIAEGRKLSPDAVRAAIDSGPLLPDEALQAKLVDHIGYRDEAIAAARKRAGAQAKLVGLSTYLGGAERPNRAGARIALIYGSGLIVGGSGSDGPLSGSAEMAADDVAHAFRAAVRDPKVRAILFRIDSPGGSVTASETIWRAVELAGKEGKPVIASMGDVAGSGGYYIAAPAAKIIAEPATLTGSIGVLAGKVVVGGLLKKIGVTTDSAQFGANAGMGSATSPFSPFAQSRVQALLDATYKGFKDHVAAGRHMSPDAVEAVAKGRVWTGADAKAHGLVDALGGYGTALRLAREAAGIAPEAPVALTLFPREKPPIELLYDRLTGKQRRSTGFGAFGRAIESVEPLLLRIDALIEPPGALSMPPIGQPR
ncbi:MAG TPA: signal peptide peptidase SppA [Stellaceae bacterium]|jgi:protease-4|nr:signal peptide peptidase SppA [Stellaceae bacterium]